MNAATLLSAALDDVKAVETKTLELFQLRETAKSIGDQIAGFEAEIYEAVCAETDTEPGQPVYSNDGARKAAATKRQSDHARLQASRTVLQETNKQIAQLHASIDALTSGVSLRKAFLHGGNFAAAGTIVGAGSVPA